MLGTTTIAVTLLAFAAQAQPASNEDAAQTSPVEEAVKTESETTEAPSEPTPAAKPEKITDRSHPDYVRCRREPVIGSRAKFTKRCFTNREWDEIARTGNAGTRRIVDSHQGGLTSN